VEAHDVDATETAQIATPTSGQARLFGAADWRRALASERALGSLLGPSGERQKVSGPITRMDDALRAIRAEIARANALVSHIERRRRFDAPGS
jgi:hypothetical protein